MLSSFSHIQLFANLWTVAGQAPLSMGSCRQEYWSGLPCPPLGDLPHPWIEPCLLHLLHWQAGFFFFFNTSTNQEAPWKKISVKKKKEKKRFQFPITRMHISHLNFMLCNESLYTVLCSWHFVPRFFLMDISNFYGKCEFNSVPSRPSASFSTNVVFKNKKPTLGKKVIAICQFNKAIGNITS